jgi:predicted nucleic acid-binding protein
MDAFDADVLIYAVIRDHALGAPVRQHILDATPGACIGSTLLLPEVLIKPTRHGANAEARDLNKLLGFLDLHPADERIGDAAVDLGARYGLKTVDAMHLATAVVVGADRFVTNNRRDFTKEITEVDVTYPDDL